MKLFYYECVFCKKEIVRTRQQARGQIYRNNEPFCSQECVTNHFKTSKIVKCKQCNKDFEKILSNIKRTNNNFCCRSCAAKYNNTHKTAGTRVSKLELFIQSNLQTKYWYLDILFNDKTKIKSELDIYIPSLSLAFEINGIFHYKPIYGEDKLKKIQINDKDKIIKCIENEIKLIIINSSKQTIVNDKTSKIYLDDIIAYIDNELYSC